MTLRATLDATLASIRAQNWAHAMLHSAQGLFWSAAGPGGPDPRVRRRVLAHRRLVVRRRQRHLEAKRARQASAAAMNREAARIFSKAAADAGYPVRGRMGHGAE